MDEVVLGTKIPSDEASQALSLMSRNSRNRTLMQLVVWCILVVPGTVAAVLWNDGGSVPRTIAMVSLPWVVALILTPAIVWLQRRRGMAVWYAAADVPRSLQVIARPHGVDVRWDGFECRLSWHQFDVIHDGAAFILCKNPRLPIVISKSQQTAAELATLREWMMAAVPKRVRE